VSLGLIPHDKRKPKGGSLLLVTLVVCLVLSRYVERVRRQQQAVATIQASGGTVMYDFHEVAPRTVSTAGHPSGPEWLRKLLGDDYFQGPVWVCFLGNAQGNEWVNAVGDLPSTKYLLLARDDVNDDVLARLPFLPNLEELHLYHAAVSDRGVEQLRKFPHLRWLVARGSGITDCGLRGLAAFELEEANLRDTRISDAGVPTLITMTRLEKLEVRGTRITKAGAERLRRALPKCKVHW
jgi:hypothetical protein